MPRRKLTEDPQALLGAAAPVALVVLNGRGDVLYRNQAALALADQVTQRRGPQILKAFSSEAGRLIRDNVSFPVVKMVAVEERGEHAEAEMTIDRFGEDFFACAWTDVTDRENDRRFLAEMASDLDGAAGSLAALGEQLAASTGELSSRTDAVASGVTEMSASIAEIGRSAAQAAANTSSAVAAARTVKDKIGELADSSAKIGAISQLITSIAEQTNLLALNATIEAARAGEAGRGFAVVANEVKELASETSRATGDIAPMITSIQVASAAVSEAVQEIVSLVSQIEIEQTTIASAVEEQSAASGEMSVSINGVASSTQSVAQAVQQLRQTATDVAGKADQVAARV